MTAVRRKVCFHTICDVYCDKFYLW